MTNAEKFVRLFGIFDDTYGSAVSAALEVYSKHMREEAAKATAAYNSIKDDAEKSAAQDESIITTQGLRMAGEMFAQAADKADTAVTDWVALQESLLEMS